MVDDLWLGFSFHDALSPAFLKSLNQFNHKSHAERNAEIIRRYQAGESSAGLAREFGVSDRRIRRIVQRYT